MPEIGQKHCGLVKDNCNRSGKLMIKLITEKEQYKYRRLCTDVFIDYAKAFDRVRCKDLFEFIRELDLFGKYYRII